MNVSVESYIRQKGQKRKLGLRERGKRCSLQMFRSRLSPRRVHLKDKNMGEKKDFKKRRKKLQKIPFGLNSKPKMQC